VFAVERAAGGVCLFAGAGSPLTHAVGIGMSGLVDEPALDRVEAFFHSRGADCVIDLCPLAGENLIRLIQSRPYRAIEFNNLLIRPVTQADAQLTSPARRIADREHDTWTQVVARGFAGADEVPEELMTAVSLVAPGTACFLADAAGKPAAGAAMGSYNSVAFLFGDATLTGARGRGLQSALINARLAAAAAAGCNLAVACVLPGSVSHRNYLRAGFQLLYMRVNVLREHAVPTV
jgi:GNAT superfamily N-acetyltransferase